MLTLTRTLFAVRVTSILLAPGMSRVKSSAYIIACGQYLKKDHLHTIEIIGVLK